MSDRLILRERRLHSPRSLPRSETVTDIPGLVKGLVILAVCLAYAFAMFFLMAVVHLLGHTWTFISKQDKLAIALPPAGPVLPESHRTSLKVRYYHPVDRRG